MNKIIISAFRALYTSDCSTIPSSFNSVDNKDNLTPSIENSSFQLNNIVGIKEATGDMALIGPNCYGLINYIDNTALWSFEHGGWSPGYGTAIVTQSGMFSSDITMSARSLPMAYMVSAGNQTVMGLADFIDILCEKPEVRAIGLHIEGLSDVSLFFIKPVFCILHPI